MVFCFTLTCDYIIGSRHWLCAILCEPRYMHLYCITPLKMILGFVRRENYRGKLGRGTSLVKVSSQYLKISSAYFIISYKYKMSFAYTDTSPIATTSWNSQDSGWIFYQRLERGKEFIRLAITFQIGFRQHFHQFHFMWVHMPPNPLWLLDYCIKEFIKINK